MTNLESLANKPLAAMTVGELFEIARKYRVEEKEAKNDTQVVMRVIDKPPRRLHGINGLCDLFGCSRSTAFRIKKSGVLGDAIYQRNRKIIIDEDLALQRLKEYKNKKRQ